MRLDFVAAVTVKTETLASGVAVIIVGTDDFHEALKAGETRRAFIVEIDQHVVVRDRRAFLTQQHRRLRGQRCVRHAVRDKAR